MTKTVDLSPFLPQLRNGGLAAFSGGTNPLKAGPAGALLSRLIQLFTHSQLSHVGLVMPVSYWPNTTTPWMVESTIWKGVSGPQWNDLQSRIQGDYASKGGHAWFREFLPGFEPNWSRVWEAAQTQFSQVKAGKLHYSVKRLFGDAAERNLAFSLLPVAGLIEQLSEHDHGVVCSEEDAINLQAGGVDQKCRDADIPWLPNVEPIPGQAIGCAPEDIWEMPIWKPQIQLL